MAKSKIGIWLIGARGGVATTTILGLIAVQRRLVDNTGLVSSLPHFAGLDLVPWTELVIGGHDIREGAIAESVAELNKNHPAINPELLAACRKDLLKVDKNIRPGTLYNVGSSILGLADKAQRAITETPRGAVDRIQADLANFVSRNRLSQLIVVNVASTEPPIDERKLPRKWKELDKQLDQPTQCLLGASSLYAIAAFQLGYPYINFTPSTGSAPHAIRELAEQQAVCHAGCDGKTGETLMKSCLGPLFASRNLHVMSWVGHNIFGNRDGKILDNPENKKSKVDSKDGLLGQILGYHPKTLVTIEYIESLGDWKTAWDHIHFQGFLGTPMTLQFTWQGCDSILAAPLVLDLVRFTERAARNGDKGLLTFLASFFKSPLGVGEHDFARQFQLLLDWSRKVTIESA